MLARPDNGSPRTAKTWQRCGTGQLAKPQIPRDRHELGTRQTRNLRIEQYKSSDPHCGNMQFSKQDRQSQSWDKDFTIRYNRNIPTNPTTIEGRLSDNFSQFSQVLVKNLGM